MPTSPLVFNAPSNDALMQAIAGLGQPVGAYLGQQREKSQNIQQGTLLENALQQLAKNPNATTADVLKTFAGLQSQGVSPETVGKYMGAYPGIESANARSAGQNKQTLNPQVQKWAYEQLGKKDSVASLTSALNRLEEINAKNVTGPIAGRLPSLLSESEANALRAEMDTTAIQLLNLHKNMFPRGLTQGEFNNLSQKVVSSKQKPEANQAIISGYRGLANLQEQKVSAVEQAVSKFGFDPMLPFMVSGIQKEFDDEEMRVNQEMYKQATGKEPELAAQAAPQATESISLTESTPKTSERQQGEKPPETIRLKMKSTGKISKPIPRASYEALTPEQKMLYEEVQ